MTKFRPCIDLHEGQVKQIIGGTLDPKDPTKVKTNSVLHYPSEYYAKLFKDNGLEGGHLIMLGPGCENSARSALSVWPMQVGGGINLGNAQTWLDAGATKVIVTSFLFNSETNELDIERLKALASTVGSDRIVVDLSCRRTKSDNGDKFKVATNKWTTITNTEVTPELIRDLEPFCSEFLVHGADVEGLCSGIDMDLVKLLAESIELSKLRRPMTYAGGARSIDDLKLVNELSNGLVDLTFGSSLDIFGGSLVKFEECVAFNFSF